MTNFLGIVVGMSVMSAYKCIFRKSNHERSEHDMIVLSLDIELNTSLVLDLSSSCLIYKIIMAFGQNSRGGGGSRGRGGFRGGRGGGGDRGGRGKNIR